MKVGMFKNQKHNAKRKFQGIKNIVQLKIKAMNYYLSKLLINVTFDEAIAKVTDALKEKALKIILTN